MTIDISIKYITNREGTRFFTQRWIPSHPKALLILVHDVGDHSGRYNHVINYFANHGYAIATYDQRGHGLSDGRRGDIDRFGRWVEDLHTFVWETRHEIPPGTPVVLGAMSVGGLIALNYAIAYADYIDGLIIISPAIEPVLEISKWKRWVGEKLVSLMPRLSITMEFDPESLSRDEQVVRDYLEDPLVFQNFSLRTGKYILDAASVVMPLAFRIRHPIMMIHAKEDKICSSEATRTFFERIVEPRKKLILYEGSFHEPLNDLVRGEAFEHMRQWLEENIVHMSVREAK